MLIATLSLVFALLGFACAVAILTHAFRRSVGTGMMVLLVPAYILVYAFTQFEHRRKGLLVAGLLAWMAGGRWYWDNPFEIAARAAAANLATDPATPPVIDQQQADVPA